MKIRLSLCMLCAIILTACSGGGSGGAPTPPPSGGGPGPGDPGGGGPGPGDPGGGGNPTEPEPSANATATITFPWHRSAATASTVVIRGTASDPEGVAVVRVNGVAATLATPASAAGLATVQARGRLSTTLAEHEGADEDDQTVEWEVEIELDDGDNELLVTVEDTDGDETDEADAVEIRYHEVPATFALDADRTRVVGLSFTLTPNGYTQRLVEHNYASRAQNVFVPLAGDPALTCLRGQQDEFFRLALVDQNQWELQRYHLGTGQGSIIAAIPAEVRDPGEGFEPTPFLGRIACSDDHEHVYVLANYMASEGEGFGSGGFAMSRVWRIELANGGTEVLTESDTNVSPPWLSMDIALSGDTLVSLADLNPIAPLTGISLTTGERSELAPELDIGGSALVALLDQDLVYVATFSGVDRVELGASPQKTSISEVDAQNAFVFAQPRSIAYDMANARLIVGDTDLDALIAVDATTGERSDFVSRRIGSGPPVLAPRRIVLASDMTTAYVADDGGNATERLFEVDLATGDRQQIGEISATANFAINGLAIDEEGGRAWVSRHNSVLEVDLATESVIAVARLESDLPGSPFQAISTIAFEAARNRLLVGDSTLQAIIEIDLDSKAWQVVSQEGEQGDGEPFAGVTSIAIDEESSIAYVGNQLTNSIMTVDLETGDREPFTTACPIATPPETLQRVVHDPAREELLIVGDGLFVHHLATGGCTTVPLRAGIEDVSVTDDGRLLVTMLRAIAQLDRPSGQIVIVSR